MFQFPCRNFGMYALEMFQTQSNFEAHATCRDNRVLFGYVHDAFMLIHSTRCSLYSLVYVTNVSTCCFIKVLFFRDSVWVAMAGSSPAVQRIYVGGWRSDITREDCGYKYKYIYIIDLCIYTFYRCRYIYIYRNEYEYVFVIIYKQNFENILQESVQLFLLWVRLCVLVFCA